MKHILVIADHTDKEQHAFEKALELARLTIADIHVVSFCYEPLSDVQYQYHTNNTQVDLKSLVINASEEHWENYLGSHSVKEQVSHEVVWEKYIHEWIIEHCKNRHYDLIVKTGHRSEKFFYTPTDWQLFRESTVPVYCVSKKPVETKKVILVALDLRTKQREKLLLNNRLLEAAFQLAVQTDSILHCCYAIAVPRLVKDLDMIDVTAKVNEVEKEVRKQAVAWFDIYDIDKKHLHIKQGTPANVVNDFARKLKAQCVVVGSMGRVGIKGKLIGNTAEKVIQHAVADLLVI